MLLPSRLPDDVNKSRVSQNLDHHLPREQLSQLHRVVPQRADVFADHNSAIWIRVLALSRLRTHHPSHRVKQRCHSRHGEVVACAVDRVARGDDDDDVVELSAIFELGLEDLRKFDVVAAENRGKEVYLGMDLERHVEEGKTGKE